MNNVVIMNEIHSSQDLIEYIYALLLIKDFITEFILKIIKISHITILHD